VKNKFVHEVGAMCFGGSSTDAEPRCDFGIGVTFGRELKHLSFLSL